MQFLGGCLYMEVQNLKIDEIKPYENNPRNNDAAVEAVANSIKEFGWQQPIVVDKDMVIIVGHTRYRAARSLGLSIVPVIKATNLSDEQVKAYRLADNQTGELADWDDKKLDEELEQILNIDMEDFGFDIEEEIQEELDQEQNEEPEVPFSEILNEQNNYVVLKFETEVDWAQAQSLFDIGPVRYEVSKGTIRQGVGRVLDGPTAINKLLGGD